MSCSITYREVFMKEKKAEDQKAAFFKDEKSRSVFNSLIYTVLSKRGVLPVARLGLKGKRSVYLRLHMRLRVLLTKFRNLLRI